MLISQHEEILVIDRL